MAARITEVRDALADLVRDWWKPVGTDEVLTVARPDIDTATIRGRKVYAFRASYTGRPATRSDDENDYAVALMVVRKFPDAGDPPDAWVDAEVAWVESLLRMVGNPRAPRLLADEDDPTSGLWPQTAEVDPVYDYEELAERKLFLSVVRVTFREQVSAEA